MHKNNKIRLLLFTKAGNSGQRLISRGLLFKFSCLFQVPDKYINEQQSTGNNSQQNIPEMFVVAGQLRIVQQKQESDTK